MVLHEGLTIRLGLVHCQEIYIEDFIGTGSSGNVYKVIDVANGNHYALKHIRLKHKESAELAKFVIKMTEESKIKLPSEYIVQSYGLSKIDDLDYGIIFEYVEGIDLDDWIKENNHSSWETKKCLFLKILDGIETAHEYGVYHKDIKPQNIIVTINNIPKILDFGLATTKDKNVTMSVGISGTLPYLAPESMLGIKSNRKFDIYSLGCILYELVRGENYLKICGFENLPLGKMISNDRLKKGSILDFDNRMEYYQKDNPVLAAIKIATAFSPEDRFKNVSEFINFFKESSVESLEYAPKPDIISFYDRYKNNELYFSIELLKHYPDLICLIVGIIIGNIVSSILGAVLMLSGFGFLFFRFLQTFRYIHSQYDANDSIIHLIEKKIGSIIILTSTVCAFFSFFTSALFFIFSVLLIILGIFTKNSEFEWKNTVDFKGN